MKDKTIQHITSMEVPLLGARTYKCQQGHIQKAIVPFQLALSPKLASGPICPVCVMEFLGTHFRVTEVVEAKEDQEDVKPQS